MVDHRKTSRSRRRTWFGSKRHVKRILASAPIARAMEPVLRRTQPPDALRRWPVPVDEVVGRVRGGAFVMLDPFQCTVAKELFWGYGHRPNPEERFALELVTALADGADRFLDIGAYTGIFSLAVASAHPSVAVDAYELVPDVFQLLFANVARNDLLARVDCHCLALGRPGEPGDAVRIPMALKGSSLPTSYSTRLTFEDGVGIPARSLDQVTVDWPDERVVMKVDIEGSEVDLLEHAHAYLSRTRPDILCEVLASQQDPAAIERSLAPLGYRWYLVGEGELLPRTKIEPDRHLRDWLFTVRPEAEIAAAARVAATASASGGGP